MTDLELLASMTVDGLIRIKDRHRGMLSREEIETLNLASNLLYHNRKELVRE